MRSLRCFVVIAAVAMALSAQSTGRLTGLITDSAEKPITNVTIVLKRLDVKWTREIKIDKNGRFLQSGLDPKEYELSLSSQGYVPHREIIKIPLGEVLVRNITLKTPDEVIAAAGRPDAPGAAKASEGDTAFIEGVGLFNDKNYSESIPKFEKAIEHYAESIATSKEEELVADAKRFMAIASNSLAISQFEVGRTDQEQRKELWLKAELTFKNQFDKLSSDDKSQERARLASQLYEIAIMKGDALAEKMYAGIIEEIEGPKAENSYNTAVGLFNSGNLAAAKPHLKRAIEINPEFAETYYLMGYCELSDGDFKAAKASFQKYLQLAPNGKYAAEVKENLAELK